MTLVPGPNLGLLENGAAGEEHYDELMRQWRGLDLLVQARVLDKDLTSPPGSPANGDAYIVAASPTGAWSGQAGKIARWTTRLSPAAWEFFTPREGWRVDVQDEDIAYRYTGSAWAAAAGTGDVTGPGSSTSGNLASFSGTSGKILQDSGVAPSTDATLASNSNTKLPTEQAVKGYVDAKVAGLSWKQAVRAATTTAGTLASSFENGDVIDGVTLATGDRILVKNQATGSENGIYTVNASGAPTRATDADSGVELVNASVYVSEGTANADTQWTCTTNAPITVGTTALAFAQLTSGGSGTIGGSTGATDNALLRADGTGGSTLQSTGIIVSDNDEMSGYKGNINAQTGTTYTLVAADTGKIVELTNASAITLTLPNSLAVGFNCTIVQGGAGQVSLSVAGGGSLRNRSTHTKLAGQWAAASLYVRTNSGGSAAEYVLAGDTTS